MDNVINTNYTFVSSTKPKVVTHQMIVTMPIDFDIKDLFEQVDKRIDTKLEEVDYLREFNLKNGEGVASIVMKTGDDPNLDYVNYATGEGAIAVGDGNIASGNKSVAVGTRTTNAGNSSFVGGQLSEVTGHSSFGYGYNVLVSGYCAAGFGVGTKAIGAQSVALGLNTEAKGTADLVGGSNVVNTGSYTVAYGLKLTVNGSAAAVFGDNNIIAANRTLAAGFNNKIENAAHICSVICGSSNVGAGAYGATFGASNNNSSQYGFTAGCNNTTSGQNAGMTLGYGLKNPWGQSGSVVLGRFNTPNTNHAFQIGTGETSTNTCTPFAVTWQHRVKVFTEPIEPEDVIRLKDIESLGVVKIKLVDELPTANISRTTLYLRKEDPDDNGDIKYTEWVYTTKLNSDDDPWELVGETGDIVIDNSAFENRVSNLEEWKTNADGTITELKSSYSSISQNYDSIVTEVNQISTDVNNVRTDTNSLITQKAELIDAKVQRNTTVVVNGETIPISTQYANLKLLYDNVSTEVATVKDTYVQKSVLNQTASDIRLELDNNLTNLRNSFYNKSEIDNKLSAMESGDADVETLLTNYIHKAELTPTLNDLRNYLKIGAAFKLEYLDGGAILDSDGRPTGSYRDTVQATNDKGLLYVDTATGFITNTVTNTPLYEYRIRGFADTIEFAAGEFTITSGNLIVDKQGNVAMLGNIYSADYVPSGPAAWSDIVFQSHAFAEPSKVTYSLYWGEGENIDPVIDPPEGFLVDLTNAYGDVHVSSYAEGFDEYLNEEFDVVRIDNVHRSILSLTIDSDINTHITFTNAINLRNLTIGGGIDILEWPSKSKLEIITFTSDSTYRSPALPNSVKGIILSEGVTRLHKFSMSSYYESVQYMVLPSTLTYLADDVLLTNTEMIDDKLGPVVDNLRKRELIIYYRGTPSQWQTLISTYVGETAHLKVLYYSKDAPNSSIDTWWGDSAGTGFRISSTATYLIDSPLFKVSSGGFVDAKQGNVGIAAFTSDKLSIGDMSFVKDDNGSIQFDKSITTLNKDGILSPMLATRKLTLRDNMLYSGNANNPSAYLLFENVIDSEYTSYNITLHTEFSYSGQAISTNTYVYMTSDKPLPITLSLTVVGTQAGTSNEVNTVLTIKENTTNSSRRLIGRNIVGYDCVFDETSSITYTYIYRKNADILVKGSLIPTIEVDGSVTTYNNDLGTADNRWGKAYFLNLSYTNGGKDSDVNLKNSIKPLSNIYSELFDRLCPVEYLWNNEQVDNGKVQMGFIAQAVKAAMDEVGLSNLGLHKEKNNLQSLNYDDFIALCVHEIQQLKKRVAELENK